MPSAVCPIPTPHSPADAVAAYKNAQNKMPGLTPAAWRKAAAQEMGIDYDTFLALWKKGKGMKLSAAQEKLIAESVPTKPAAVSSSPTMGITTKVSDPPVVNPSNINITAALNDSDLYVWQDTYGMHFVNGKPGVKMNVQQVLDKLKQAGYTVEKVEKFDSVKVYPMPIKPVTATQEAIDSAGWTYSSHLNPVGDWYEKLGELTAAFEKGLMSVDEYAKYLADLEAKALKFMPPGTHGYYKTLFGQAKLNAGISGELPTTATGVIQTAHGPLTHDLAQSVYKKMKADMPNATPAVWRHAAADYLKVDYNDYLAAWKKPTTAAQKAKQTPGSKLPPASDTPLSPSTAGIYADEQFVSADTIKDELARLYGPNANKSYMNVLYDDIYGTYSTTMPTSLVPTTAGKQAVVDGLQKLGFKVEFTQPNKLVIQTIKNSKTAGKTAAAKVKQIKASGTATLPNGTTVLDFSSAQSWSNSWWSTLTQATKNAWKSYTGSGYHSMNGTLRRGGAPSTNAKLISQSMPKLEHEITVFRGAHMSPSEFRVGSIWTDNAFMSTAINPGSAWSGTKFEIVLPKGTKGMYIGNNSSCPGENEFLIDMFTKYHVVSVQGNNVRLVAIPHD